MSQIDDVNPRAMRSAGKAIRPVPPTSLPDMSDADLVDELRGQKFAKDRADARIAAIGAELTRRGRRNVRGQLGQATLRTDPLGRVDLKRLRAEQPEICQRYAIPGSTKYWSVRTLTAEERA